MEVTDKIVLEIKKNDEIDSAIIKHKDYIAAQTLAIEVVLVDKCNQNQTKEVEIDDIKTCMSIEKA